MQSQSSWTELFPPLTLMYLSSVLKNAGHSVMLRDAMAAKTSFTEELDAAVNFEPQLIFLNTAFPSIYGDFAFGKKLKEKLPDSQIAITGILPTLLGQECLQNEPWLDYAIIGEPEKAALRLVKLATTQTDAMPGINEVQNSANEDIPGIAYKSGNSIIMPSRQDITEDLDCLPFPDRDSLDNSQYKYPMTGEPMTMINTTRGCPYPCIFCLSSLYYGKKERRRSVDSIIGEIKECINKHKIRCFIFWGEAISYNAEHLRHLCETIISQTPGILWMGACRADQLDNDTIKLMKKSGCHMVTLGLESAVQEILDKSKKNSRIEIGINSAKLLREAGIKVMGHFIIGLPGETKETAAATRAFAKKHCDYAQFYCAVPYPGTEFAKIAEDNGWIAPHDWQDYSMTRSIVNLPDLSAKQAEKLRFKAFQEFYFRPGIIWDNLKQIKPKALLDRLSFSQWMKRS